MTQKAVAVAEQIDPLPERVSRRKLGIDLSMSGLGETR